MTEDEDDFLGSARRTAKRMMPKGGSDDLPYADEEQPDTAEQADIKSGRIGNKPLQMVRFDTGGQGRSFSYSHLYDIEFEGQSKLVLTFSEHTVAITGWGLGRLHVYLERHIAKCVAVSPPGTAEMKAGGEGVESIDITPIKP